MKVLVIGGTKYFGRHLVNDLVKNNHEVVLFSRGLQDFPLKSKVIHIKGDRNLKNELTLVRDHGPYDLVFDQVCMSGENALEACEIFKGFTKRYIMTSTGSVYDFADNIELTEEKFTAESYLINTVDTTPYNYQEAKRQAEAYFLQKAPFEVACVRFPIVLGEDDYTKRLLFHVDKVKNNQEIYFPNIKIKMGFINSQEAGEFLAYLGLQSTFSGSVNAASTGYISLLELMNLIELKSHQKMVLAKHSSANNSSPFGAEKDFIMPNKRAASLGFHFKNLNDYLPKLVEFFLA